VTNTSSKIYLGLPAGRQGIGILILIVPGDLFLFVTGSLNFSFNRLTTRSGTNPSTAPPQSGHFFDGFWRRQKIILTGHHEEGIQMSIEAPIHGRHVKFVFEVGGGAEALKITTALVFAT